MAIRWDASKGTYVNDDGSVATNVDPSQVDWGTGASMSPTGNSSAGATQANNWVGTDGKYYGPSGSNTSAGWNAATGSYNPTTGSGGGSGGETAGAQMPTDLSSQFYGKLKSDGQAADGSGLTRDYLSGVAGGLGTDLYGIGQGVFGLDHNATDSWLTGHGMGAPAAPVTPETTKPTPQQGAATYNPYDNTPTMQGYTKNPYLDDMAANITRQASDTWSRNILPATRSGAMAAGGFGGSREGVVEANAANDLGNNLTGQLANLYGNDYQQTQNRNLSKYQTDVGQNLGLGQLGLGYQNSNNSYDLGLRSSDLGYANLDAGINQNNFNNQLSGANFGLSALDRMMGYNSNATDTATTAQNKPMSDFMQWLQASNAAGGNGGTTTGSVTQSGNGLSGAIGGATIGSALYKYLTGG